MALHRVVAVIPTFNNAATVADVVASVREYLPDIIVVNDGSTDGTGEVLDRLDGLELITVVQNRGKGHALRLAFSRARERGFTHAITIDADGQHPAMDIPRFLEAIEQTPQTLVIGNRVIPMEGAPQPARSRFGAAFGAFWYRFSTGRRIDDTQCGFRAYPLAALEPLRCRSNRYEYEIEILIQAAWAGIAVEQIPIHLLYQPPAQRVSHFRPLRDFARISVINSRAAITRIFMPWRFVDAPGATAAEKIRFLFVKELTAHHSPTRAAGALALGACIGLMPIHGLQVLAVLGLSVVLRLNRALAFLGVTISSPPLLPFWLAAGYGIGTVVFPTAAVHQLANGLASLGLRRIAALLVAESGHGVVLAAAIQWAVGSVVLALLVGLVVFVVSLALIHSYVKIRNHAAGGAERS